MIGTPWKASLTALACALVAASGLAADAPGRAPRGRPHGAPPEAVEACATGGEGDACAFTGRFGDELLGTCEVVADALACVPEGGPPPHRPPQEFRSN